MEVIQRVNWELLNRRPIKTPTMAAWSLLTRTPMGKEGIILMFQQLQWVQEGIHSWTKSSKRKTTKKSMKRRTEMSMATILHSSSTISNRSISKWKQSSNSRLALPPITRIAHTFKCSQVPAMELSSSIWGRRSKISMRILIKLCRQQLVYKTIQTLHMVEIKLWCLLTVTKFHRV